MTSPRAVTGSPAHRIRRVRRFAVALTSALALTVGLALPAQAVSGSISGSSACRSGYASTSSSFAPSAAQYAITARAVYYGYSGQILAYGPFLTWGTTYAHYVRTGYSTWSNTNVSDVFWVWWAGTPDTGLTLLNHIHVDCNT